MSALCQKRTHALRQNASYSNTSSARVTNGDLPRPRVLEALRLMTKSNFVGCKTGRSAGLSPQRIGTETLVSAACVTAAPLRYTNNVATNPQAAANISQSPATARLSVAWIK
jgi:hypothetical protein